MFSRRCASFRDHETGVLTLSVLDGFGQALAG
jgi:hypothetical protein